MSSKKQKKSNIPGSIWRHTCEPHRGFASHERHDPLKTNPKNIGRRPKPKGRLSPVTRREVNYIERKHDHRKRFSS